jgi:RNA polymerase sigma-70 factor, ECF subfamily
MGRLAIWSNPRPPLQLAPSEVNASDDPASAARAAEAMVEGLRRGDPAVTRRFFELYHGRIERILRRLLGPIDELEDLVHDVFVDALEAIDKLREPAALSGWVRGIAVITAKRRLLKAYRRRWLGLTATGTLPDVAITSNEVESREAFRSAHHILNQLHPEDRIALLLYRLDELTADEAAKAMGLSPSTFKRRLRRGEDRLLKLARKSAPLEVWLGEETKTP